MSPRTFLLEDVGWLDLAGSEEFGERVVLYHRNDRRPGIFTPEFVEHVRARLHKNNYKPGFDYIMVAGRANVNAILVAVAAMKGVCRLLTFNANSRQYIPCIIGDDDDESRT